MLKNYEYLKQAEQTPPGTRNQVHFLSYGRDALNDCHSNNIVHREQEKKKFRFFEEQSKLKKMFMIKFGNVYKFMKKIL